MIADAVDYQVGKVSIADSERHTVAVASMNDNFRFWHSGYVFCQPLIRI